MKKSIIKATGLAVLLLFGVGTVRSDELVASLNPPVLTRAASNWTVVRPSSTWDSYSWKDPRDWWPFRDFHVVYYWPASARAQLLARTTRAARTFKKAQIDGGIPSPTLSGSYRRLELTAGYRARIAGPYSWWENAGSWANELRVQYR